MIRNSLQQIVTSAITNLVEAGRLSRDVLEVPVEISDTKQPEHGDFACNFAMVASKKAGMNPRQLGEILAEGISEFRFSGVTEKSKSEKPQSRNAATPIKAVEVAGPGFLNIRLEPTWIASFVPEVINAGSTFGILPPSDLAPPTSINVEFVSVNPNGPITIGSGRGAAYGSTLCNVLEAAGSKVHREYYINDGVNSEQMRLFAVSAQWFAAKEAGINFPFPEKGYKGDYVEDCALSIPERINHSQAKIKQLRAQLRIATSQAKNFQLTMNDVAEDKLEDEKNWSFCYRTEWAIAIEQLELEKLRFVVIAGPNREDRLRKVAEAPSGMAQQIMQDQMLHRQWSDLRSFGVTFDTWFSEQSLHDSGTVAKEIEQMIAAKVADEQPIRTTLKLARGGVIEDVVLDDQKGKAEVDDEHGEPAEETLTEEPRNQGTEQQDTLWLRSAKFGDDMDRVLRRRDGRLTYIASDVAYHKDKLTDASGTRGTGPVDKMITILGPDHHGYIGRLQAVVAAMLKAESNGATALRHNGAEMPESRNAETPLSDLDSKLYTSPEERDTCQVALAEAKRKLEVQIYQLVRFVKDGKPAPMRKRDGNIYALIDLMKEIGENVKPNGTEAEKLEAGKDVARFFYLMRSHDTTFDFDLDLAQKQSDENPVFYVQYAHARISSVIAKAAEVLGKEQGVKSKEDTTLTPNPLPLTDFTLLTHERELTLIKKICDLPFEVQRCAKDYGVHRLTTYAIELARTYHHFYDVCRVIQPEEPELTQARLALCQATRSTLKSTLDLLGISAPERMDRAEQVKSEE